MGNLVSALALMLAASGASVPQAADENGATPSDAETIFMQVDRHQRMTVPVHISKQGPFRFMVDTGAQHSAVSTELAARLAMSPSERRTVAGVAGLHLADTAILEQLALGTRTSYGLQVLLLPAANMGADGIIGTDSLQSRRVLLDFVSNRMIVGDAEDLGGNSGFEIVVKARRRAGRLIVTNARIDGIPVEVVIDTGAHNSIGNRALQRALRQARALPQAELLSVTGQQTVADVGTAGQLAIGRVAIGSPIIAYADAPAFAALALDRRPALLLGMRELRLFSRVAIDFSTRKVLFDIPQGA